MSSQRAHYNEYSRQLTQEQQAALARQLIVANEHYRLSNSDTVELATREQHRQQAKLMAEEVLVQDAVNDAAMNLLGRIALDEGKLADASTYLQGAIDQAPGTAGYYINLGYVHLSFRDYEQAETIFNRALELKPNAAQAYAGVAYTLLRRGDYLGAFLRLRSLEQKGYDNPYCRRALFDAIQHLWADRYDASLEQDLITYYQWQEMDAFLLGNLTASLLVHKYELHNESAQLDFDTLVSDRLLIGALQRSLLPNTLVESLLTGLRQSILLEAFSQRNLRDSLQPFVGALAQYMGRTGYALAITDQEQQILISLHHEIQDALQNRQWQHEDLVGALMLVALYEPLYRQSYSFQLLRDELADWPVAVQPIFQAALYELADQHLVEYEIVGTSSTETLAATPLVRGASPLWETLGQHPRADYRQALGKELGDSRLSESSQSEPLQILVAGCRSGQRALSLASFFEDVEVTACDPNLDNVVFAVRAASRFGLNNLCFHCAPLGSVPMAGASFDVIECGPALGPAESIVSTLKHLATLLKPEGIIRFTLPRRAGRHDLEEARNRLKTLAIKATPDNVRAVRQVMMREAEQGLWQDIVAHPDFYTLPGTRDLLFADSEPAFNLREINEILRRARLQFIGFVDLDPASRQRVRTLNQRDLMAWHTLDESQQTVFHDTYELYCRKV